MNVFRFFICIISGAAMGTCLLYPKAGPLIFFSAAPALSVIFGTRERIKCGVFCLALCGSFCSTGYLPAFGIVGTVSHKWVFWLNLLVYLLGSLVHGMLYTVLLYWGIEFINRTVLHESYYIRPLAAAGAWTLAEWICGSGAFAWPTLRVSLALWRYPILIQAAKIGGQLFVSWMIMAVNGLLAEMVCGVRDNNKRRAMHTFIAVIALFIIYVLYGVYMINIPTEYEPEYETMAVIQPGIRQGESLTSIYERAKDMAAEAAEKKINRILLPESILNYAGMYEKEEILLEWKMLAQKLNTELLAGGLENNRAVYYQFGINGEIKEKIKKYREVPFFENGYGKPFRWIQRSQTGTIAGRKSCIGVLLCYESFFSSASRSVKKAGADLLAVPCNDSWFSWRSAKELHLAASTFRAVETNLPLIQIGLNGYTAVLDARGSIKQILPLEKPGILYVKMDSLY